MWGFNKYTGHEILFSLETKGSGEIYLQMKNISVSRII